MSSIFHPRKDELKVMLYCPVCKEKTPHKHFNWNQADMPQALRFGNMKKCLVCRTVRDFGGDDTMRRCPQCKKFVYVNTPALFVRGSTEASNCIEQENVGEDMEPHDCQKIETPSQSA